MYEGKADLGSVVPCSMTFLSLLCPPGSYRAISSTSEGRLSSGSPPLWTQAPIFSIVFLKKWPEGLESVLENERAGLLYIISNHSLESWRQLLQFKKEMMSNVSVLRHWIPPAGPDLEMVDPRRRDQVGGRSPRISSWRHCPWSSSVVLSDVFCEWCMNCLPRTQASAAMMFHPSQGHKQLWTKQSETSNQHRCFLSSDRFCDYTVTTMAKLTIQEFVKISPHHTKLIQENILGNLQHAELLVSPFALPFPSLLCTGNSKVV